MAKIILELPKFQETFNPILDVLSNGETIQYRELIKQVIEKHYENNR